MITRLRRLSSFLMPIALVALAVLLTVPWTYWVILAAYERDVLQNAQMLARRVEVQVAMTQKPVSREALGKALSAELFGDGTVDVVVFADCSENPRYWLFTLTRHPEDAVPRFTDADVAQRATGGLRLEEDVDSFNITVPWRKDDRILGFTYVELSRQALRADFWNKEGPLIERVLALTTAVVAFISAVAIMAFRYWQKSKRVELHAHLEQQGLMAERGLTAAVLAHEIRNPLAALRFQLHSLRKGAADAERVAATADTIDGELLRIQKLVTDYLEHEKAVTLQIFSVDLEDEARRLQTLLGGMLRESGTRLVILGPDDPVLVACDPHALRQVLMNLVLNAQEAMGRGGSITLRISREDAFGAIDVIDTGPGIPEEMRDRLFKPFQTSRTEGTGIGLALVKRFVDNFGGTITVDSQANVGTTFHLKLPLSDTPSGSVHVPPVDSDRMQPVS